MHVRLKSVKKKKENNASKQTPKYITGESISDTTQIKNINTKAILTCSENKIQHISKYATSCTCALIHHIYGIHTLSSLTLLGGLSDTGDNIPCSDADTGLFDKVLVGEDPVQQINNILLCVRVTLDGVVD